MLTTTVSLLTVAAAIASDFQVELGEPVTVANPKPGVPIYPWFPDGHITVLPDKAGLQMYWAGSASYRTVGAAVDTMRLSPAKPIRAKGEPATAFDTGGAWLYSVVAVSNADYIGFYHAEDHQWHPGRSAEGVAWKSVALCTSGDGGATWSKKGQILTSARQKPDLPAWGGCGDHCVVFDKGRWFCFFRNITSAWRSRMTSRRYRAVGRSGTRTGLTNRAWEARFPRSKDWSRAPAGTRRFTTTRICNVGSWSGIRGLAIWSILGAVI